MTEIRISSCHESRLAQLFSVFTWSGCDVIDWLLLWR